MYVSPIELRSRPIVAISCIERRAINTDLAARAVWHSDRYVLRTVLRFPTDLYDCLRRDQCTSTSPVSERGGYL